VGSEPVINTFGFGTIEECDCCHDAFSIHVIRLVGKQFLCPKCRKGMDDEKALPEVGEGEVCDA